MMTTMTAVAMLSARVNGRSHLRCQQLLLLQRHACGHGMLVLHSSDFNSSFLVVDLIARTMSIVAAAHLLDCVVRFSAARTPPQLALALTLHHDRVSGARCFHMAVLAARHVVPRLCWCCASKVDQTRAAPAV